MSGRWQRARVLPTQPGVFAWPAFCWVLAGPPRPYRRGDGTIRALSLTNLFCGEVQLALDPNHLELLPTFADDDDIEPFEAQPIGVHA